MPEHPLVRLIRPMTEPPDLFLPPGHDDHLVLSQLLSEGRSSMTGVVFDPTSLGPQQELRNEVRQRNLWAVLDTRFMELARPNGQKLDGWRHTLGRAFAHSARVQLGAHPRKARRA